MKYEEGRDKKRGIGSNGETEVRDEKRKENRCRGEESGRKMGRKEIDNE